MRNPNSGVGGSGNVVDLGKGRISITDSALNTEIAQKYIGGQPRPIMGRLVPDTHARIEETDKTDIGTPMAEYVENYPSSSATLSSQDAIWFAPRVLERDQTISKLKVRHTSGGSGTVGLHLGVYDCDQDTGLPGDLLGYGTVASTAGPAPDTHIVDVNIPIDETALYWTFIQKTGVASINVNSGNPAWSLFGNTLWGPGVAHGMYYVPSVPTGIPPASFLAVKLRGTFANGFLYSLSNIPYILGMRSP